MRYFIGGLIIKAKEYPQWKHFQYRQEGETQLIILEQDYIPLTNHGLIHSIDDIDIFKTDNRYELSYKGIAVMCIWQRSGDSAVCSGNGNFGTKFRHICTDYGFKYHFCR